MKSLTGGFGEEGGRQVGWRGEVTRYFVDREMGGREGTGDQRAVWAKCGWEGAEGNYVFFARAEPGSIGKGACLSRQTLSLASIGRAGILRPSGASFGEPVVGDAKIKTNQSATQLNLGDAKIPSDGAKWAGLARRVGMPEARLMALLIRGLWVLRTSDGSNFAITPVSWLMVEDHP